MNNMTIQEIEKLINSKGFIKLTKELMHNLTNDGAIVYSELLNNAIYYTKTNQLTKDGYFFCTVDTLEENCNVMKKKQQKILSDLVERGLISIDYRGLPKRRYIKVLDDREAIYKAFSYEPVHKEKEPMPENVRKKYQGKHYDVAILKKQIDKSKEAIGCGDRYADILYDMYIKLFEATEYPNALSTKSVSGCLSRLFQLDGEYYISDFYDDYLQIYTELPDKPGVHKDLSNLLTAEMLEPLSKRMGISNGF